MKLQTNALVATITGGLFLSSTAFGAGFQINEHSATATGRVSAVTATIDDPSAIFHNPAGLTEAKGTQFQVGVTGIIPRGEYQGPGLASTNPNFPNEVSQSTTSPLVPVPNVYMSRALSEKAFVGLGFYLPYGLGIKWDNVDDFVGRTVAHELSLRTFYFTPTIALKLADWISVAVSVSLVPASVYLKRTLGAPSGTPNSGEVLFPQGTYSSEGTVEVSGTAFGVGANAGIQMKFLDHLRVGLAYRSAVDLSFDGNANFDLPAELPTSLAARFPDQSGSADLTIPHTFSAGIGWVQGALSVEASAQLTLWNSYDALTLMFDEPDSPTPDSSSPRDWTIVPLFRLGGQYKIGDAVVRAGVAYDISPVPDTTVDPTLPDNDRLIWSLGGGYDFGYFSADIAYMNLFVFGRDVTAESNNVNFATGTYTGGMVHLVSLTLGVQI